MATPGAAGPGHYEGLIDKAFVILTIFTDLGVSPGKKVFGENMSALPDVIVPVEFP